MLSYFGPQARADEVATALNAEGAAIVKNLIAPGAQCVANSYGGDRGPQFIPSDSSTETFFRGAAVGAAGIHGGWRRARTTGANSCRIAD